GSHGTIPTHTPKTPNCKPGFQEGANVGDWTDYNSIRNSIFSSHNYTQSIMTVIKNFENSILFLLSCFQYIIIAAVFSVGPPYRKSMITNVPFIITTAFFTLLTAVILISPSSVFINLLELENIDYTFRWYLLAIVIADFFISLFMEKYAFDVISRWIGTGRAKSDKKMFKKILAEMDAKEL
ncbi:10487_t:CDS:2, partial [Dentiscutata heterogama]